MSQRLRATALAVAAGLASAAGCTSDDNGSATVTLTITDPSRPATAPDGTELAAVRTLPTDVRLPPDEDPAPLIVFAHGLDGDTDSFSRLLDGWADAGFVVASPTFPLTNSDVAPELGEQVVADVAQQPTDVDVVIDAVLAESRTEGSDLEGRVDPERIGVGGMSLGGGTVYGLLGSDCCDADRVDAGVVLAGKAWPESGVLDLAGAPPILVMHGDADEVVALADGRAAWQSAASPKWFVTLLGATHAPAYLNEPSAWDAVVESVTTDFWLAHLAGDTAAGNRLEADATAGGVATIDMG